MLSLVRSAEDIIWCILGAKRQKCSLCFFFGAKTLYTFRGEAPERVSFVLFPAPWNYEPTKNVRNKDKQTMDVFENNNKAKRCT